MSTTLTVRRRLPVGAEVSEHRVRFKAWAPVVTGVRLVMKDGVEFALRPEVDGYFSLETPALAHGDRYWVRPGMHPLSPEHRP